MTRKIYILPLFLMIVLCATPVFAESLKAGDTLPSFVMEALPVEGDAAALGLKANGPFTLKDIDTPYILIEIIGVYCPICHEQAPALTRLYKRLKKTKLDKQIKMLGIAAGGTPMEVKYIRERNYPYPVVSDTEFDVYNALSEPKTPFTLIVDKQGKVLDRKSVV